MSKGKNELSTCGKGRKCFNVIEKKFFVDLLSVIDRKKKQAAGRDGGPGWNARPGLETSQNVGIAEVTFAYFEQYADQVPYHVLQKARTSDSIDQERVLPGEMGIEDGANLRSRAFVAIVRRGESGEIMLALDQRRRFAHCSFV